MRKRSSGRRSASGARSSSRSFPARGKKTSGYAPRRLLALSRELTRLRVPTLRGEEGKLLRVSPRRLEFSPARARSAAKAASAAREERFRRLSSSSRVSREPLGGQSRLVARNFARSSDASSRRVAPRRLFRRARPSTPPASDRARQDLFHLRPKRGGLVRLPRAFQSTNQLLGELGVRSIERTCSFAREGTRSENSTRSRAANSRRTSVLAVRPLLRACVREPPPQQPQPRLSSPPRPPSPPLGKPPPLDRPPPFSLSPPPPPRRRRRG